LLVSCPAPLGITSLCASVLKIHYLVTPMVCEEIGVSLVLVRGFKTERWRG